MSLLVYVYPNKLIIGTLPPLCRGEGTWILHVPVMNVSTGLLPGVPGNKPVCWFVSSPTNFPPHTWWFNPGLIDQLVWGGLFVGLDQKQQTPHLTLKGEVCPSDFTELVSRYTQKGHLNVVWYHSRSVQVYIKKKSLSVFYQTDKLFCCKISLLPYQISWRKRNGWHACHPFPYCHIGHQSLSETNKSDKLWPVLQVAAL